MQLMLTLFGTVFHVSVGLDRTEGQAQLVCLSAGDFEVAGQDEPERAFGFGRL